jgi:hypothetical protein
MTDATLPVRAISSSYEKPPGQVRIIVRMLVPAQDLAVGKPAGPTRRKHPPTHRFGAGMLTTRCEHRRRYDAAVIA